MHAQFAIAFSFIHLFYIPLATSTLPYHNNVVIGGVYYISTLRAFRIELKNQHNISQLDFPDVPLLPGFGCCNPSVIPTGGDMVTLGNVSQLPGYKEDSDFQPALGIVGYH